MNSKPRTCIVVFFGYVASGKSYLASSWAKRRGCRYHNSDVVRKELAGRPAAAVPREEQAAVASGLYTRAMTEKTYKALIDRARADLSDPSVACVVLDGSFLDTEQQQRVMRVLGDSAEMIFIYCFCSDRCRKARLKIRESDPEAVSDGRWEVYQAQKRYFTGPTPISGARLLELDTERPLERLLQEVDVFVGPR